MSGFRYKEYKQGRRFILKIIPGESLVECITQFALKENIHYAVLLSAVGSVRDVCLRGIKSGAKLPITPARVNTLLLEGPLELLSLTGNIVPDETNTPDCHLHIMAGKSSCDVIGGHLFDARVFATCEIVLTELVVEGVERHHSTSGGIPTIYFNEE
jgi:predicted DNA-binding protein with PD1-like motif